MSKSHYSHYDAPDETVIREKTEASFKLFDELSQKRLINQINPNQKNLVPVLRAIQGPYIGDHFLLNRESNEIGRDSSCQITIKDHNISRRHCKISICYRSALRGEFKITIEDLGSRNGVRVNGQKIEANTSVSVQNGDQIRIGSNIFGLYLKFPEEIELEAFLYKMARKDSTTGLIGKSFFMGHLEFEFKRAQRYKRPLSFVLLDIDFFKKVNDTYGHVVGDEVLKKVGQIIQEELRIEDTAIRYGGEEIALILPETPEKDAYLLAERLRIKLERLTFKMNEKTFKVTASFGVAEYNPAIAAPQGLVEKADRALYKAKESGRNNTFIASQLAS